MRGIQASGLLSYQFSSIIPCRSLPKYKEMYEGSTYIYNEDLN
jgi:hypothetical protein